MQNVGLLVGHGFTKAVCGGRCAVFPSIAAPAAASDFDTALGAARRVVELEEGGNWLVGRDALDFAPGRLVSILDRARYRSPAFVALARAAIGHVVPELGPLRLMTGMPAAWFPDKTARSELEAAILEAARPWGEAIVSVAPEPASIFYSYVFESGSLDIARTKGAVGVVDCGYRDVGVALFNDGRYISGESIPGGTVEALREIKRLVAQSYGLELSLHEVDGAVRSNEVVVDGLVAPMPEGTASALLRALETVTATGRSLWPNGGRGLRTLLLGGGGAYHLAAPLQQRFPQLVTLDGPQVAGARGFAAAAAVQAVRRAA